MQYYAFDHQKFLIHAKRAKKNCNYICIECGTRVRLRGGNHRQLHFYHLDAVRTCGLRQKSMAHLQTQDYFLKLLPLGDCKLEYRFKAINRIADVAWLSQKIVFEIQCSPISALEIQQRNQDYQSLGWTVVWILHDQRYNQQYMSPAENTLKDTPHYFTNMNARGEGVIYDQFSLLNKSIREQKMAPLLVDLSCPIPRENFPAKTLLAIGKERLKTWTLSFAGDLLNTQDLTYHRMALALEKVHYQYTIKRCIANNFKKALKYLLIHPYRVIFRYFLEKACR